MNVSDMTTQLLSQMIWSAAAGVGELPAVGNQSQQSGKDSFQSLLEDKRTQSDQTTGQSQTTQDKEPVQDKPVQEEGGEKKEVQSELPAAALLLQWQPQIQPQQVPLEGEGQVEGVLTVQAQPVEAQPMAPVQQEAAQAVLPQTQAPVQTQPAQTPAQGEAPAQAPAQEGEVPAVQTAQPQQQPQTQTGEGEAQGSQTNGIREKAQTQQVTVEDSSAPAEQAIPAQIVLRETGEMPVKVAGAPELDTTAEDFDLQLKQVVQRAADGEIQRVEIQLTPANLGRVAVEMTRTGEGALQVVLHVETEQARSLLTEHAKSLGLMLQGNNPGEVRVEVTRPQQGEQPWQQPDQNGGQRQDGQGQEDRRQNSRQQQQSAEDFLHQLRIGLFQTQQV